MAGISGEMVVASAASIPIDASFDDLVDSLDAGMMFETELRVSKEVGFLVDFDWMSLEENGVRQNGVEARGDLDLVHGQFNLAYRPPGQENVVVDLLAGLRVIAIDARLESGVIQAEQSETIYDGVVGLRSTIALAGGFQLMLRGDVGGFGTSNDLSYQFAGILGYAISDTIGVGIGYRQLGVEFSVNELAMDMAFSGPIFGMQIAF
jgi:hypothetical protein